MRLTVPECPPRSSFFLTLYRSTTQVQWFILTWSMEFFKVTELITNLPTRLVSAAASSDRIYLGTSEGTVLEYVVERSPAGAIMNVFIDKKRSLSKGKKAVEILQILGESQILAAGGDGCCDLFDARTLDLIHTFPKDIVGVAYDQRNKLRRFHDRPQEFLVFEKKRMYIYTARGNRFELKKQLDVEISIMNIEWCGTSFFIGTKKAYYFFDPETEKLALIANMSEKGHPSMRMIDPEVGCVLRYDNVGFIYDSKGESTKKKFTWSATPSHIAYEYPWVLGLLPNNTIEIHNCTDQTPLQTLKISDQSIGLISGLDGALLLSATKLCAVSPPPVDVQITELLAAARDKEAIALFMQSCRNNTAGASLSTKLRKFYERVGAGLMRALQFQRAFEYFRQSDIPLVELCHLIPGLLPSELEEKTKFVESPIVIRTQVKKLMGDVANKDPQVVEKAVARYDSLCHSEMCQYLEKQRSSRENNPNNNANDLWIIDTALVKLYEMRNVSELLAHFLAAETHFRLEDVAQWAERTNHYRFLAQLYAAKGKPLKALEVWQNLGRGVYYDVSGADGIRETVQMLSTMNDTKALFEFGAWIMQKKPDLGISIFTAEREKPLPVDQVLAFLKPYAPTLSQLFLEAVIDQGNDQEKFHTQLGLLYLDVILALLPTTVTEAREMLRRGSNPGSNAVDMGAGLLGRTRHKCRAFLTKSELYDATLLLNRIGSAPLYEEKVTLYERQQRFLLALQVIVQELENFPMAEQFCLDHEQDEPGIFAKLLEYVLGPPEEGTNTRKLNQQGLRLLESYPAHFPPSRVFGTIIPDDMPLHLLSTYLARTISHSTHQARESTVERSIHRASSLIDKCRLGKYKLQHVVIGKERRCGACGKFLGESFACVYPNGTVIHFACAKDRHVDPVTHRDFRKDPVP